VVQGFLANVGRRLAVGGATLTLVTGAMAWTATQSTVSVALASPSSSCSNESSDRCDSKAGRTEDAKEAQSEKQCRATHTAKFCRDQARAEDRAERENNCDEEGDRDENKDCEVYGGSGDSSAQIGAFASVTKSISVAGYDASLVGTAGSLALVVGTVLLVAVRRRRMGPR
jgi:hypothetical protein